MKTIQYDRDWEKELQFDWTDWRFTTKEDVSAIIHLIKSNVTGNIVEIGANRGVTTRNLALNFPDRIIYGVEYIGKNRTMIQEQAGECPEGSVFERCEDMPNVVCIHGSGKDVNYGGLVNAQAVFIDGDHSYEGVKADTLNAFSQIKSGLLIWHDCSENETWSGVLKWLNEFENGSGVGVTRVSNSTLAFAVL